MFVMVGVTIDGKSLLSVEMKGPLYLLEEAKFSFFCLFIFLFLLLPASMNLTPLRASYKWNLRICHFVIGLFHLA